MHSSARDASTCDPAAEGASAARAFQQFESRLAERTEVSSAQAERLGGLPRQALSAEARSAAQIVQRFADAASAAMGDPRHARTFLSDLDLRLVTRDHDWRAIFGELMAAGPGDGHRERVAVWNYLAYLCSRRDLLDTVMANRKALEATDEIRIPTCPDSSAHRRLPKDSPAVLTIPYRGALELRLGKHAFTIVDGYPPKLVDAEGRELRLAHGLQEVGRHPSCDLVVSAEYLEVSRGHLVVEWNGDSTLTVTDRSSLGTYVAASAVAAESPPPMAASHTPGPPPANDIQAATRYAG